MTKKAWGMAAISFGMLEELLDLPDGVYLDEVLVDQESGKVHLNLTSSQPEEGFTSNEIGYRAYNVLDNTSQSEELEAEGLISYVLEKEEA